MVVNSIPIFSHCIMSDQETNNTYGKLCANENINTRSTQDEINIMKEDLFEAIDISNLLNAGPSDKLKSLVGQSHLGKSSIQDTLNYILNDNLTDQFSNYQELTSSSAISLDLPEELLNIGPSEKLKRLRRPIPPSINSSEVSLPRNVLNVNLTTSETMKRLQGPTTSLLSQEFMNLGPSEKLQRLRGPIQSTDCCLGNNLPNELKNVGPSEKLRKLRGPTPLNKSLLKRRLPDDPINARPSQKCKRFHVTDRKPKENSEKPHQIFQKRLQAILKKPHDNTLKKIEPAVLKANQVTKNTKAHGIRSKGVGNTLKDNKKNYSPIPIPIDQISSFNTDQTCIVDLKGKPKLIIKGSGKQFCGPKTSKFFKVPLKIYDELNEAFEDSQSSDKKLTEHTMENLEHYQQNTEIDKLTLVHGEETNSEPEYIKKEILSTTPTSQHSNNVTMNRVSLNNDNDDDSIISFSSGIASNDDAPKVKLNSNQTISISRNKNNSLRKELNKINELRRRFPKTYKKNTKRKFLFGLRNKVDSINSIAASAMSEFLPNRIPTKPLEPIDLEAGEWHKLFTPSEIRMPIGTSIAPMIHRLRARLPTLTGKDKLEVSFLLSIMSTFPNMPKEIKELMYQRLNLVYLAIMFDWETALTLAQAKEQISFKPSTRPNVESKSNQEKSLANTSLDVNNCSKNGCLSAMESTRTSLKPQYRFEIIINEPSVTGTALDS